MTTQVVLLDEPATVRDLSEELACVYRTAFGAPEYGEGEDDVRRFVDQQLPQHLAREGFRLAAATVDGSLVGFAYGYTGERGQWWTDRIAAIAPAEVVQEWVGGHFELVELAVDPAVQGRGIGAWLHERLLEGLPHDRALLSTYREDRPATRLYRRLGWQLLVPDLDERNSLYGLDLTARRGATP